jgi:hypothetical protein
MTHANDVRLYLAISQILSPHLIVPYSSHFETLLGKSRRSRCSGISISEHDIIDGGDSRPAVKP